MGSEHVGNLQQERTIFAKKRRYRITSVILIIALLLVVSIFVIAANSNPRLQLFFQKPWIEVVAILISISILGNVAWAFLRPSLVHCFCPHCGMHIRSDATWSCGYCGHKNETESGFSFLRGCGECPKSPDYLLCPHCKEPIVIGHEGKNIRHAARIKAEASIPPVISEEQQAEIERQKQKAEREHAILIARLDTELAKAKAQLKQVEKPNRTLEDDLEESKQSALKVHEIFRREVSAVEEQFKGDPDLLEMNKSFLEDWKEKHL